MDLLAPLPELPHGVGTVIHIAGEKRDESRMWATNHEGTRKLVEAAGRVGVRRFIYLSSVGVYGAPKHAGTVNEHSARTPRNTYEASKNAGETVVRENCTQLGMEHVIVQPTNVIGHVAGRSYPLLGLISMINAGRFARFGRGETWTNYVGVNDVAAMIVAACRSGCDGGTYIANGPARLSDLVAWVSGELGLPPSTRRLPAWVGALAGAAGSLIEHTTKRSMPFNSERYREMTNTTQYDGEKAVREFGFAYPVGIETTVRHLVQTYRTEGRL